MVRRILVILFVVGILGMAPGCYVEPYYAAPAPYQAETTYGGSSYQAYSYYPYSYYSYSSIPSPITKS
jgi:hypothetical protein